MLSRWSIEDAPTKRDPNRRLLFVKGSLADVHGLIRKLGAVCGRPKKEKGNADFNFSLALRKLSDDDLSEIQSELRSISPGGEAATDAAEPESAEPAPAEAAPDSGDGLPIEIALASGGGPAPIEETPVPQTTALAAEPEAAMPEITIKRTPEPAAEPVAEQPSVSLESPAGEKPDAAEAELGVPISGLNLSAPGGAAAIATVSNPNADAGDAPFAGQGPSIAARPDESAGASPSTPEPVSIEAPRTVGGGGPSGLERLAAMPLFGGLTEREVTCSLENFVVGAFNRFAHAGGMSILTSPGTLYQPLFVSGPSGSGKTHLLHGLADKLQQQAPDDPVWITSGARLARAVAWAISSNRFSEMEEYAKKARTLIIDDLQFMGIADHNKVQLAAILKIFTDDQKQIVLSSAYPPEMVAAIEQALEIRITAGHAVELKTPNEKKQDSIVKAALERCGLIGDDEEVDAFAQQAGLDFNSLGLILRRALVLQALRAASGQAVGLADMHGALFQSDAGEPQIIAAGDLEGKTRELPSPAGGSRTLVLLYPQGQEVHAEWALRQVAAAAYSQAWEWTFADAIRKPYAVDPASTVPFVLAEEALQAGADAVLVLGPQPGAELAEHEGDSRYVLKHLLKDGEVSLGWVPYQRVHDPKYHLHAFLDMQGEPIMGVAA